MGLKSRSAAARCRVLGAWCPGRLTSGEGSCLRVFYLCLSKIPALEVLNFPLPFATGGHTPGRWPQPWGLWSLGPPAGVPAFFGLFVLFFCFFVFVVMGGY